MDTQPIELPALENLLVAALYLATNFAKSGCPRLSHLLLHQLEFVLRHPREDVPPAIRETCQRLHQTWKTLHAERVIALSERGAPATMRQVH